MFEEIHLTRTAGIRYHLSLYLHPDLVRHQHQTHSEIIAHFRGEGKGARTECLFRNQAKHRTRRPAVVRAAQQLQPQTLLRTRRRNRPHGLARFLRRGGSTRIGSIIRRSTPLGTFLPTEENGYGEASKGEGEGESQGLRFRRAAEGINFRSKLKESPFEQREQSGRAKRTLNSNPPA